MIYSNHYTILGKTFYLGHKDGNFILDVFELSGRVRVLTSSSAITWGELKSAATNYVIQTAQIGA